MSVGPPGVLPNGFDIVAAFFTPGVPTVEEDGSKGIDVDGPPQGGKCNSSGNPKRF